MIEYLDTQFLIFGVGILSFIGNYIMKGDDDIYCMLQIHLKNDK